MRSTMREQGVMLLDTIVGSVIVSMLLGLLAVSMMRQHATSAAMSTQRRLDRLAEGVLTDLQLGKTPSVDVWDTGTAPTYRIRALSGEPCAGWRWAEVTAACEDRTATLVGVIPDDSARMIGGTP